MFWMNSKNKIQFNIKDDIPLLTPIERMSFIVFDTEATGFEVAAEDRLLEIGAVLVENLRVTDTTFRQFVNPQREIPQTITDLTGITAEMVANAPTGRQAIQEFADFIADNPVPSLVAHCAGFDVLLLEQELKRDKSKLVRPRTVDTINLLQLLHLGRKPKALEQFAADFGTPVFERHTAIGDALTTAHLLVALLKQLKRRYRTWGELMFAIETRERAI